jgi:hypothetical protein
MGLKRNKKTCEICSREISLSNISKHKRYHDKNPNKILIKEEWKDEDGNYNCPYCNKKYKKLGIGIHIFRKHTEQGKKIQRKKTGTSWNKGLTKETDERVKRNGEQISKSISGENNHSYGKKLSDERKQHLSKIAKQRGIGGKTYKKIYKYKMICGKEIYMDSSYEIKVAEELDKNNIRWERPISMKWTDKNNKEHNYFADFYLIDYNVYLDPKNDFLIEKDKEKIELVKNQNDISIFVLNKKELSWEKILDKILKL